MVKVFGVQSLLLRVVPPAGAVRKLVSATLLKTVGDGLFATISVLYFARVVGLGLFEIGFGLTIAGLVGVLAAVPLGYLSDNIGAYRVLLALTAALGPALLCYLGVNSFLLFVAVACLIMLLQRGCRIVLPALIVDISAPADRVAVRAQLQVVTNIGIAVGAGASGFALYLDSPLAYGALVVAAGLMYMMSAATLIRMPARPVPTRPAGSARRVSMVLRDFPYMAFTMLNAVLSLNTGLLEIAIPLWLVWHTAAPIWLLSVLIVLNTLMVVLFQMKISARSTEIGQWAHASRLSGLLLGFACLLYAVAGWGSVFFATGILVVATIIHVGGEMYEVTGEWGLSFALAPRHMHGQYQGMLATGHAVSGVAAPMLMAVMIEAEQIGWLVLAAAFIFAGLLIPATIRWAVQNRERSCSSIVT